MDERTLALLVFGGMFLALAWFVVVMAEKQTEDARNKKIGQSETEARKARLSKWRAAANRPRCCGSNYFK